VRVTCPPIAHPCYMAWDMARTTKLIAHRMTIDESAITLAADSLHFLSVDGMMRAINRAGRLLPRLFPPASIPSR